MDSRSCTSVPIAACVPAMCRATSAPTLFFQSRMGAIDAVAPSTVVTDG